MALLMACILQFARQALGTLYLYAESLSEVSPLRHASIREDLQYGKCATIAW